MSNDWRNAITPFDTGRDKQHQRGTELGYLADNDPETLNWLIKSYEPKPWLNKKTNREMPISQRDLDFRAALDDASAELGAEQAPRQPERYTRPPARPAAPARPNATQGANRAPVSPIHAGNGKELGFEDACGLYRACFEYVRDNCGGMTAETLGAGASTLFI